MFCNLFVKRAALETEALCDVLKLSEDQMEVSNLPPPDEDKILDGFLSPLSAGTPKCW